LIFRHFFITPTFRVSFDIDYFHCRRHWYAAISLRLFRLAAGHYTYADIATFIDFLSQAAFHWWLFSASLRHWCH
jgi:hypothetical protein